MSRRRIRRVGSDGTGQLVRGKLAHALVSSGRFEYIPAALEAAHHPVPDILPAQDADYESMSYNDLRRIVAERGLSPTSARRSDLLDALRGLTTVHGTYSTRDMRAD